MRSGMSYFIIEKKNLQFENMQNFHYLSSITIEAFREISLIGNIFSL